MKKIILLLLILTLITSCKKRADILLNMSDFPVQVGDQWTYQQTFYDFPEVDTAILKITAKMVYNSDSTVFNTQTIIHGVVADSGILIMSPSEYKYVPTNDYFCLFGYSQLSFPITGNSVWTGQDQYDTLRVVAFNQKMTVLGNTYNNVVEVIRAQNSQQYFLSNDTLFICPNIGVIQVGIHVYTVPIKTVKLISYQLN